MIIINAISLQTFSISLTIYRLHIKINLKVTKYLTYIFRTIKVNYATKS